MSKAELLRVPWCSWGALRPRFRHAISCYPAGALRQPGTVCAMMGDCSSYETARDRPDSNLNPCFLPGKARQAAFHDSCQWKNKYATRIAVTTPEKSASNP
jgi:hypothetical protein